MLAIKLKQIGKKHQRTFRIVVDEKRSKVKGANLEDLGFWNPHTNKFGINKERVMHWIKNGAQPTDSVHNILLKGKVIEGIRVPMHKVPEKPVEAPKAEETAATETPVAEEPKTE